MKRLFLVLLVGAVALTLLAPQAQAIPYFKDAFNDVYADSSASASFQEAVKEANCNVCHYGKSKKNRNDFGVALSVLLDKKDYKGKWSDADAATQAKVKEAFEKVAKEKNHTGEITFGELIQQGKIPGAAPADAAE